MILSRFQRKKKTDRELEEFRSLMEPPSTFEDGFSWLAFVGALFVSIVMVPGAIYMALIAGSSVGEAAKWVTVILFIEVARRANKSLKKAEIFTLFYLTGAIMAPAAVATGMFHGGLQLLWKQFYVESSAAISQGISEQLPGWVAPRDADVLKQRNIFMWEWLPAIGLIITTTILGRLDNMILGYGLFRLTSDVEKLPFPMAPLGAQGIMALSEEQDEESNNPKDISGADPVSKRWRWRVFSIGSAIGLAFGFVYFGIPVVSGALLDEPIVILPLPWVDFTQQVAATPLKAVALAISWDLGMLIIGMVLPFFAMLGSFIGLMVTFIANPILYEFGVLHSWQEGVGYQETLFRNNIDFYLMFTIGISLAIAGAGIVSMLLGFRKIHKFKSQQEESGIVGGKSPYAPPEDRGDIRPRWIIVTYIVSTALYIGLSCYLLYSWHGEIHRGVFLVMLIYGFLYTPLISYATARLEGIAGQVINVPFVREAGFILSGYQGAAVWFLPMPLHNYGQMTVFYRQAELTGTRFGSIWKAEILLTPLVIVSGLLFAHLIWQLGDIPGPQYMFAQEMWDLYAENQSLIYSSTLGGYNQFEEALNFNYIGVGFGLGTVVFAMMSFFGLPTFLIYGVVRGLGQSLPHGIILEFIGALIGRYYFQKRMGLTWRQYIPVIAAGFACGMGLIGTLGVGIVFLVKSVFQFPI